MVAGLPRGVRSGPWGIAAGPTRCGGWSGLLDAWEADQADQARQAAPAAEAAADPVHTAALQELGYLE